MDKTRVRIHLSSSVANFKEGVEERFTYQADYKLFIGLYHWVDYLRFLLYRKKKRVFWCGSDILNLTTFWAFLIRHQKAIHICENDVEQEALAMFEIEAKIQPVILADPDKYNICYKQSLRPHVYVTCHEGRVREYGVDTILRIAGRTPDVTYHIYGIKLKDPFIPKNILFHGKVSKEQFDYDIRLYHAALRLNNFDGFGEVLAKSILLGQYPISKIYYPGITYYSNDDDLVMKLNELKHKKVPNPMRDTWYELLKKNI